MPVISTEPSPEASPKRSLAAELVHCMGRDSAIHVCKLNGWQGVLEIILAEPENKPEPSQA